MIAVGTMLAGCTSTAGPSTATLPDDPPPADYRAKVVAYVRANFVDPYSIRDAQLSAPVRASGWLLPDVGMAWSVCLRANAKNRMGAYSGRRDSLIRFKAGEPVASLTDAEYHCGKAAYEPFPEIEGQG